MVCSVCVFFFSYLLVLSDSLLLLLDPPEFQCVWLVSPRDDVVLRAVCAADLTARPCRFVNVSARGARPTLRHRVVLLFFSSSFLLNFVIHLFNIIPIMW